jgi:hypothetical protein
LLRAVSETGKPIDKLRRLDLFRQVRVIPADASTISAFWARNTDSSWVRRSVISGDPRCMRVSRRVGSNDLSRLFHYRSRKLKKITAPNNGTGTPADCRGRRQRAGCIAIVRPAELSIIPNV